MYWDLVGRVVVLGAVEVVGADIGPGGVIVVVVPGQMLKALLAVKHSHVIRHSQRMQWLAPALAMCTC